MGTDKHYIMFDRLKFYFLHTTMKKDDRNKRYMQINE